MAEGRDDRSLGDLFAELAGEIGTLVRQELRQAGTEVSQRATSVGKDVGGLVAGAVVIQQYLAGSPVDGGSWPPRVGGCAHCGSCPRWRGVCRDRASPFGTTTGRYPAASNHE